jgi:hypothetical protein
MRGFVIAAAALLVACPSTYEVKPPPAPSGPGVAFSWPRDGQWDVPVTAQIVVHFSDPLTGTPALDCATAFCVEGPAGSVDGQLTVAHNDTIVFTPAAAFDEGTAYRVHAHAALLNGATNLDKDPLLTFTTRLTRPVPRTPAAVVSFEDAPPDGGVLPFLDAAPLRLIFSEPIDPSSVSSATVTLKDGTGALVPATLSAGGAHVVLDPDADLTPGATFTLAVSGLRDLGGETVPDWSAQVVPVRTAPASGKITQTLSLDPAWTPSSTTTSLLSGGPANASTTESPLIGAATLGVVSGGLTAELGQPDAFGGPIPMVLRKGQTLVLSPLDISFGGAVASSYQTQALRFTILNDAAGWLTRSPFRPAAQRPDDQAPVFVDVTLDTVLSAEDPQGNAMSAQTFMGMRLLGLSLFDDDQLVIEQVGSIELSTLGINVAPTRVALRLRTGAQLTAPPVIAPKLTATLPVKDATEVPPDRPIELIFSAPLSGGTATLTENGATVAASTRVNGTALIVTLSRRLADNARIVVSWSGLTSTDGEPVAPSPDDALMGQTTLAFTTAVVDPTMAPPKLAFVSVGAPCAIMGETATSGGVCAGGQGSDNPYAAFALPADRDLRVGFTQPMDPTSFTLGPACGLGAIRVERLDGAGNCVDVVPGTLNVSDRGFRFVPAAAFTVGTRYQLVMRAGSDALCSQGELCGANGVALDTDPLSGSSAGGPNVVLQFNATAPGPDSYQPLTSEPYADLNDNGTVDADEVFHDENRVAMEITGTHGIVSDASLNGTDCVPSRAGTQVCTSLRADLPVVVGKTDAACPVGPMGTAAGAGTLPCLEVRVLPNVLLNTSMSMNTTVIGLLPINDLPTNELIMRVREPTGPAIGYIMREPGSTAPSFVIKQSVYLDAPDLSIAGGLASHDLHSKALEIPLKGPVTFLPDGRMHVALTNLEDVPVSVNISAGLSGGIDLNIPKGELHLTVVGPPLR